jgi:hypothetical protein
LSSKLNEKFDTLVVTHLLQHLIGHEVHAATGPRGKRYARLEWYAV